MTAATPSLFDALEARNAAIAVVSANAEQSSPGFAERAEACILAHLAAHGPTPGEDLTDACVAVGIVPHDPRAFGGVYLKLANKKRIVKDGYCARRKGHGTSGGIKWRLGVDDACKQG